MKASRAAARQAKAVEALGGRVGTLEKATAEILTGQKKILAALRMSGSAKPEAAPKAKAKSETAEKPTETEGAPSA